MRIFFLIFLLAYVGGNVYIFIRTLQMLSGFSLAMKILLSVVYWLVAFSLVIAMLTRFGMAGVYTVHDFCFVDSGCDEDICAVTESRFLLCVGSDLLSASVRLL